MADKNDVAPIIVKKIKKSGGGHHGGAWKVAYADFVTAMMAFFLLLWLLSVTTEEQKEGISDFYNPEPTVSASQSGAGQILGGLTLSPEGQRAQEQSPDLARDPTAHAPNLNLDEVERERLEAELKKREEEEFKKAKEELKKAIEENAELKDLEKNLLVDITPEGLRIQIVDQEGESMFPLGSARMYQKTEKLLGVVAQAIRDLPNQVSVRGHTDGAPYQAGANYTNWELSADRANAARKVLKDTGLGEKRLNNVVGKADKDHFVPDNPMDPRNRRLSIILLHQHLTREEGANKSTEAADAAREKGFQQTPAAVQFP